MDFPFHEGELVAEGRTYTLIEISVICGVPESCVSDLVAFGVVDPSGDPTSDRSDAWVFTESSLQRAKRAMRLQRELGLEAQGLALTLDLLEEVERLRRLVRRHGLA
jgi:chaperone modulatory protein CbpM